MTSSRQNLILAPAEPSRELKTIRMEADLVVVGGGLAGTCAAITAARLGLNVILFQDRPVLGGNASSEVRLWTLGATCHMNGPIRWGREGGLIDEILVENLHRNAEGNALLFDALLLEKAVAEPNLRLFLNTAVDAVGKSSPNRIDSVSAFCSQNSTRYHAQAPLFLDASGDGIVAFLAGAAFRMGAESRDEFGEGFAPDEAYGSLLGHSLYFYTKDMGKPVPYVAPEFALPDIEKTIPRYTHFNTRDQGCQLWWIEYGGRLDTVHETETIKWELWRVAYGAWDYLKNSGKFPEAENLTLEWIGHIPGKRESRRFIGDHLLTQQDVVESRRPADTVAFGGWALDLHPADGVYSEYPGCTHEYVPALYGIPYRCLYSANLDNLFLGGRTMSVTHVAFGTTRVMATLAHCGQAIAHAAALCRADSLSPRDLGKPDRMNRLQRSLQRSGQHLPGFRLRDPDDLAASATISASSELELLRLPADGPPVSLKDRGVAQMIPVQAGPLPSIELPLRCGRPRRLRIELRVSDAPDRHLPGRVLHHREVDLPSGETRLSMRFDIEIDTPRYLWLVCLPCEGVEVLTSEFRCTGLLRVDNKLTDPSDPDSLRRQTAQPDKGIPGFEIWTPVRRPGGHNLALSFDPPLRAYPAAAVQNGVERPTNAPNAWAADPTDPDPALTLEWDTPVTVSRLELAFDTDFDHPMESVLMGHPERTIPFCLWNYRILDDTGKVLHERLGNHQTRNDVVFDPPVSTTRLRIACTATNGKTPPALFAFRAYA